MACLSWKPEGTKGFTVAANPIYLLSPLPVPASGRLEFEVLEADAELLSAHVGEAQFFYIDNNSGVFAARLGELIPTRSTHPVLKQLGAEPVLRAYLEVVSDVSKGGVQ